jgi:predicted transglutaminase-like protease
MLNSFRDAGHSWLFDIGACKCAFDKCYCDEERKVPIHEQSFLTDQRSTRLMFISNIDRTLSRKLKCKYKRKLANASRIEKYRQYDENSRGSKYADNESSDASDDDIALAEIQKNIRMNTSRTDW